LEGLLELTKYLLRTALIAGGYTVDGVVSMDVRNALGLLSTTPGRVQSGAFSLPRFQATQIPNFLIMSQSQGFYYRQKARRTT
jgi:hypothetical protein